MLRSSVIWLVLLCFAPALHGQEEPVSAPRKPPVVVPQPEPVLPAPSLPEISVTATPQVDLGRWVRINVLTSGKHPRVRIRQVLPGDDIYLPGDDGEGNAGLLDLGNGRYALTWSSGEFTIEADAQTPNGTITAITRTVIGEPVPPGPPPVVKTLADLAGTAAPALAKAYGSLLELFDDFDTVKHFHDTEVLWIAKSGLTGHGATAEIARRLNVATKPLLQTALEKVVANLGSPSLPPGPTVGTAVVYVYEKDDGGVPPAISAAISELNAPPFNLRAGTTDDDVTDGSGAIPDQYAVSIPAARAAGLPALVVTAGKAVKKVVKAPTTKEQVLEAIR